MKERYERNTNALSQENCESLSRRRVCVIGCGGLGGYVVEMLARTGISHITVVDPDVFCESNLNRQLFSTEKNLGTYKAAAAKERIAAVNSDVTVHAVTEAIREENASEILRGHDAVVDALDNVPSRLTLSEHCRRLSIPLVHGAISGWCGQVSTILPHDDTMNILYQNAAGKTPGTEQGNLAFTAAVTASFQCGEVIKLLTGKGELLSGQLLRFDLLSNEYAVIELA